MGNTAAAMRSGILGIDPIEVTLARRGFHCDDVEKGRRLEAIGTTFVAGYGAAIASESDAELVQRLAQVPVAERGFAHEGAGMALALLDRLTPWRRDRLVRFLEGAGAPHVYLVCIGAGWAWARLGRLAGSPLKRVGELPPVEGALSLDGFGFHEAYFHPVRTVRARRRPSGLGGDAGRSFDAGVGRALWFVCGAEPTRVAQVIGTFDEVRRPDLWSGIGLACAYAGGVGAKEIDTLAQLAGPYRPHAAQGTAFAAKARERAGTPADHTRLAVERVAQTRPELAAKLCDAERAKLDLSVRDGSRSCALLQRWRVAVRETLSREIQANVTAGQRGNG